jgi:hypothetical protein
MERAMQPTMMPAITMTAITPAFSRVDSRFDNRRPKGEPGGASISAHKGTAYLHMVAEFERLMFRLGYMSAFLTTGAWISVM